MSETKKTSILLVEDEENLHEALKLNLELEGYDVTLPLMVPRPENHRKRIFRSDHS